MITHVINQNVLLILLLELYWYSFFFVIVLYVSACDRELRGGFHDRVRFYFDATDRCSRVLQQGGLREWPKTIANIIRCVHNKGTRCHCVHKRYNAR